MILRARIVVTMNGRSIDNGAVAVAGTRIVDVGRFNEIRARHSDEILDLGEQLLLPGLINAHCHLDYTCLRGKIPQPHSFTDWIRAINAEKEKLSPQNYVDSIRAGFDEARRFGTTTIANLTAFPELISEIESPIRTWWFAELIDVREPKQADAMVDRAVEALKSKKNWGLSPHAPFTASPELYRRCERSASLLTTHVAESEDEMIMSYNRDGPLYKFLESMRVDLFAANRKTPVEYLLEICRVDERWIIAHLNSVLDSDISLLAPTKCHVVHCPRSHEYFQHPHFQFQKFREHEFNICLGTDSLASNGDLSLFAEMREFQQLHPTLSAEEILRTVTTNPARALRSADSIGQIAPGFFADLIAIPVAGDSEIFEQIISFENFEPWQMSSGKVIASSPS